ncbi:flagellar basal body L-ring protein FlgH [Seleniivibrio woodruffii]|uniref:flagellar basal body L-ring protein FlgH n=1 Tax=Seleniivibrio woodruffii TaxID=1078050 RepID=UPI0024090478|nr:flagellar basal body L-ring protein FlgH [Seleniivibrio woodruffii]
MIKNALLMLVLTALLTAGCAKKPTFENDALANSYKKELEDYKRMQESKRPTASLWTDTASQSSLFLDYKGRHIGDIITVNIVESSSATNSNSTSTAKSQAASSTLTNLMGLSANLGVSNLLGTGNALNLDNSLSSSNTFQGNGAKSKTDRVTGTIAARVLEVLPSGNLVIEGHREIIVDNEKQTITLSGIVRQKDIAADNTVESIAIADAKIAYSGSGMLSDANRPGWLMTLVNWIMPF